MATESSCIVTSHKKCGRARPTANSPCSPPSARPAPIVEGSSARNRIGLWAARLVTGPKSPQPQAKQTFLFRVDMDSPQAENYERLAEMLALKKLERRTRCKKLLRFCGSSNAEEAKNLW